MTAAAAGALAPAPIGAWSRRWSWIDDRLNPILVKEVRQALRGRYFRNLFWFTVVAATGISVLNLLTADGNNSLATVGTSFFHANFTVMAIATMVFVPFWAFQSMSGEWEENTYDLLVISNLRPRQLLIGKALAAGVQSLLCFSAFAPYLASTFLMGGVDLWSIFVILGATVLLSWSLSMIALAVASFGRSRVARALLAIALLTLICLITAGTVKFGEELIRSPENLRSANFALVAWIFLSIVLLVSVLALAVGCARIAHEHENRSTFLRTVVTLNSIVLLGWGAYGAFYSRGFFAPEWLWFMPAASLSIAMLPLLFFVTEAEPFGRRVVKQVPNSRWRAMLALPFLPGGGRGMWLYLLTALLTVGVVMTAMAVGSTPHNREALLFVAAMFAYGFVTIGLISGIASFRIRSLRGRTGVRIAIPMFLILVIVGPTFLGFLLDLGSWTRWRHPFNPFWVLANIVDGDARDVSPGLALLSVAVVVTLVVNARRLWGSLVETMQASAARRRAERSSEAAP
ncbi:MAG: hypothetical protein ABI054_01840 [Planctomycetota bacterium]